MPNLNNISRFRPTSSAKRNLVGQVFGDLLVIAAYRDYASHLYWLCICRCRNAVFADDHNLRKRQTTCDPCGRKIKGLKLATHGMTGSYEYSCWKAMRSRCFNPNNSRYKNWGGRGITVCSRWLGRNGFANFYADLGPSPSRQYSVERYDNDGNYCPENCAWEPAKVQQRNKRNTVRLTFKDLTQSIADWADETGISLDAIRYRIRNGWSAEKALTTPIWANRHQITHNGETKNATQWAAILGVNIKTVTRRIRAGQPIEQIIKEAKPYRRRS